jgi:hypothetical protein
MVHVAFIVSDAVRDEYSLRQIPGCTQPARPARCFVLAWEHQSATSVDVEVLLFCRTSRTLPVSITATTSGMVTLVSAILVLSISFLHPGFAGRNALRWSPDERVECIGMT